MNTRPDIVTRLADLIVMLWETRGEAPNQAMLQCGFTQTEIDTHRSAAVCIAEAEYRRLMTQRRREQKTAT